MTIEITEDNFETEVTNSPMPVLLDFWSTGCGLCRMISPVIDQIAVEMKGIAKVGKVNVGNSMNLAMAHKVSRLPTLIFFKNGHEVDRILQGTSKDNIIARLKACV